MRILYLLPKLVNSGPSNVVATLISHREMAAHDITIATFLGKDDTHDNLLSKQHVNYLPLGGVNFRAIRRLVKYVKAENIEVVHSHGLIPDIVSALIAMWIPSLRVTTIHCDIKLSYQMEYPWLKTITYTPLHFLALRMIPNRAVVSHSVQNTLPFPTKIVRNGVPQQLGNEPSQPANVKLPNEALALTLVFAGRLIKLKNVEFIIDCVNRFNQEHKQAITLNIFGDGENESALKAQQSKQINFLGFDEDFSSKIPANAIFVNASFTEGMPMAVIEALAKGAPCILSNIEPHREIASCITSGVVIFDFTYDSFVAAIEKLTNENQQVTVDREALATSFSETLSDKQMVNGYLALYQHTPTSDASLTASTQAHSSNKNRDL